MNQLAQIKLLLLQISSTLGSVLSSSAAADPVLTCVDLIAVTTCQSRTLAYYMKRGIAPPEVGAFFGLVQPSWGHAKRICKVIKSEKWRQIRMYYDWLNVLVLEGKDPPYEKARLRHFKSLASNTAEFLWRRTLLFLPKNRNKNVAEQSNEVGRSNVTKRS